MARTIKQVADEIGVSKTAIRKYIDEDFKSQYITQEGERSPLLISDEGIEILKSKCKGKQVETKIPETQETTSETEVETTENHAETDIVKLLQTQLETLNKQLEVKDQQIKELTEANSRLTEANVNITESLKASQALHAADKQLLLESQHKKSLWSRLFGSKKEPRQVNEIDE